MRSDRLAESSEPEDFESCRSAERTFVEQLAQRTSSHGRPATKARLIIAVSWQLILVCGASAVPIVVVWATAPPLRQLVVDTALALGLGSPVSDAELAGITCSRRSAAGAPAWSRPHATSP